MVYMIKRWKRGQYWFYVEMDTWTVHWQESAALDEDSAYEIARIVGGDVVPRNAENAD